MNCDRTVCLDSTLAQELLSIYTESRCIANLRRLLLGESALPEALLNLIQDLSEATGAVYAGELRRETAEALVISLRARLAEIKGELPLIPQLNRTDLLARLERANAKVDARALDLAEAANDWEILSSELDELRSSGRHRDEYVVKLKEQDELFESILGLLHGGPFAGRSTQKETDQSLH
jgi:hypothetical protein